MGKTYAYVLTFVTKEGGNGTHDILIGRPITEADKRECARYIDASLGGNKGVRITGVRQV